MRMRRRLGFAELAWTYDSRIRKQKPQSTRRDCVRTRARGRGSIAWHRKGISGQHCSVEYFDAPVSKPIVLDLDIAAIEAVTLPEQTRIYHFNDAIGAWEIGRLLDDHGDK
jgi:hypothetical protein